MHKLVDPLISIKPESGSKIESKDTEYGKTVRREVDNLEWTNSGCTFATVENARCPHHYSLPIQYFCLDCKDGEGCFCSECALTRHAACDVKTLKEAFAAVLNNVIRKWATQLNSRSENLEVTFAQILQDKRDEWAIKLQELQTGLFKTTDDLGVTLRELESSLTELLRSKHRDFLEGHDNVRGLVEKALENCTKNAEMLRQQRRLPPTQMLLFYNENYAKLRKILLGMIPQDSERMIETEIRRLEHHINATNGSMMRITKVFAQLEHCIRHAHGGHKL